MVKPDALYKVAMASTSHDWNKVNSLPFIVNFKMVSDEGVVLEADSD